MSGRSTPPTGGGNGGRGGGNHGSRANGSGQRGRRGFGRAIVALLAIVGTVLAGLAIGSVIARRNGGSLDNTGDQTGSPSASEGTATASPSETVSPTATSSPVTPPATPTSSRPTAPASTTHRTGTAAPVGPHSLYVIDLATAHRLADQAFQSLTERQRIGQLFMVGVPVAGASTSELKALQQLHVGSYFLHGRSSGGVASTARSVRRLQPVTAAGDGGKLTLAPFVSADQEGGQVQTLRGPGFSTIPDALTQGELTASTLRARSARWGAQLAAAGVNLNLAPVADTVPASLGRQNQPIGRWSREYGHEPGQIATSVSAFVEGMTSQGVATSAKHFPGLGRVIGNTDTTAGVTDSQTVRGDEALKPFAAAIESGSPMVMMSSAIYSKIDPGTVAAFSPVVIGDVLRGELGFQGVVVSDDLGAAKAVAAIPAGERAVRFFGAGGDLLLTVSSAPADDMVAAVVARSASDPAFAAKVDDAVRRVLLLKARMGLLTRS